jgi:hypothetical protein
MEKLEDERHFHIILCECGAKILMCSQETKTCERCRRKYFQIADVYTLKSNDPWMLSVSEVYEKHAKTLNKPVSELSKHEKVRAMALAAMEIENEVLHD